MASVLHAHLSAHAFAHNLSHTFANACWSAHHAIACIQIGMCADPHRLKVPSKTPRLEIPYRHAHAMRARSPSTYNIHVERLCNPTKVYTSRATGSLLTHSIGNDCCLLQLQPPTPARVRLHAYAHRPHAYAHTNTHAQTHKHDAHTHTLQRMSTHMDAQTCASNPN